MPQYLGWKSKAQAVRFGIPVDSFNPAKYWIASLDYESARPTVDELVLIRSYQQYIIGVVYNETYARKLRAMALPADGGHNTTILRKLGPGEWQYRKMSWRDGPLFVPSPMEEGYEKMGLKEVLDRERRIGDHMSESWTKWKRANPELFGHAA